ncbi:MAG: hypothetical protein HFG26_05670 [Provencibacterium sp.]|jgi:hypothetical protein|nr:hypothetical protein [Provencibacterium sp.]
MEKILEYVKPELLVLIPVLSFTGIGLKRAESVADKYIPLLLGGAGILLALLWVLSSSELSGMRDVLRAAFAAITQGILCAGCSVYIHQVGKQVKKGE